AHHTTSVVFRDQPDHTRIRKLFAPAFTPKALAALDPPVERFVDGLLDRAAARGGMDVVEDFAAALPVQLIGDMLGVPTDERGPLRGWSLAILGALEPRPGAERLAAGSRAVEEFKDYLRRLIADRRRPPGSIWAGRPTSTWRSSRVSTPARACGSRAWKGASPSAGSSRASRICAPRARPCAPAGRASASSARWPSRWAERWRSAVRSGP